MLGKLRGDSSSDNPAKDRFPALPVDIADFNLPDELLEAVTGEVLVGEVSWSELSGLATKSPGPALRLAPIGRRPIVDGGVEDGAEVEGPACVDTDRRGGG